MATRQQQRKDETTFRDKGDDPRDREQEEVNDMARQGKLSQQEIEQIMEDDGGGGSGSRSGEKQRAAQDAIQADEAGDKQGHHTAEQRMEQAEVEEELEDIRDYTSRIKASVMHHREMSKFHEQMAQKLLDTAKEEGVIISMEGDEGEDDNNNRGRRRRKHGRPNRSSSSQEGRNLAGEPPQPGGQGRVTDPSQDKRLKQNETEELAAARANEQDDDRGQVKDPDNDRRLKENETRKLASARANDQDDDRGQVKDPENDGRLKKNRDRG